MGEEIVTQPLVSVIIPTYNRASFLTHAIESVLRQTYKNIEIIVVDDGSTDNTKVVIDSFKGKVQYIFTENNKGPAHARNTGMKAANGKYIAFLDSDDEYLPFKLECQVTFLEEHPDLGMVFSEFSAVGKNSYFSEYELRSYWWQYWQRWQYDDIFPLKGEFSVDSYNKPIPFHVGNILHYVLLGPLIFPVTILFPKKIIEIVGFQNEDYRMAEDYEFTTRICKYYKVGFINIPTYMHHYHDGQLITPLNKKIKTKEDILVAIETSKVYLNTLLNEIHANAEYYNCYKKDLDKRLADLYKTIGVCWLEYGAINEARKYFKQSYNFYYKRRRLRIYWLISFFPQFLRKFILGLKNK
jgi:glycosyltransferase involved in cell wall biosynthesis